MFAGILISIASLRHFAWTFPAIVSGFISARPVAEYYTGICLWYLETGRMRGRSSFWLVGCPTQGIASLRLRRAFGRQPRIPQRPASVVSLHPGLRPAAPAELNATCKIIDGRRAIAKKQTGKEY